MLLVDLFELPSSSSGFDAAEDANEENGDKSPPPIDFIRDSHSLMVVPIVVIVGKSDGFVSNLSLHL